MKLEKTCKYKVSLTRKNDNYPERECEFRAGREYQVDVYVYLDRSHYKVYQNGGWNDFVFLEDIEFRENFEIIE